MIEKFAEDEFGTGKQSHPFLHLRSRRLHVVLMLMYAYFCMAQISGPIGFTLSCMCNSTAIALLNQNKTLENSTTTPAIPLELLSSTTPKLISDFEEQNCAEFDKKPVDYGGDLVWDTEWQSAVVSATFFGGFLFSYPAGFLVDRFSARHNLSAAIFILTAAAILMPFLATTFQAPGAIVSRFFMGVSETLLIPSLNSVVTKWIPVNEKSLAAAIFTAGNQLSGIFGNILIAELCASPVFGWSSIFYSASLFGISWLILWHLTVRNSPHNTKWIHERELDYLANQIPPKHNSVSKKLEVPWKGMLTSRVFWALMCNSVVGNMMIALIFIYMPVYFKDVLKLDVKSNGFYSAIPHLSNLIAKLIWGYVMDMLRKKKIMSPTATCKLSQFTSMMGISVSCFLLTFVNCNQQTTALVLLSCISVFFSLSISGFYTALLSIAPSHIGTLTGFGTVIGFLGRSISPLMMSIFQTETNGTKVTNWPIILLAYTFATAFGAIIFVIFASAEVQEWDYSKRHKSSRPNALVAPESEKSLEDF
ncbi:hypothetical protein L5515_005881 [Caenorhabditis briggsae]|uniref:Major facilitator superfamily (MFS) profile domain-containing protein n=2 Tax=Caenorhabditis briggsae TaxID=6238 RepID=A0AAE9EY18_CAEBR|nr:hypothetical protein L5515_005881 [Caenorhabditis briggsae]